MVGEVHCPKTKVLEPGPKAFRIRHLANVV